MPLAIIVKYGAFPGIQFITTYKLRASVESNPNIMNFKLLRTWQKSNFKLTRTQVRPPKPNFEPFQTPPKSPNFKPVQPEIGLTKAQIWKNWTSNPSKPRFIYQNWTTNPPKPSKNPELRSTNWVWPNTKTYDMYEEPHHSSF